MVRQDIVAGLKNAVARGYSLQQAMQGFINAGYNAQEVQQAAASLSKSSIGQPQQPKTAPVAQQLPQQRPMPQQGQIMQQTQQAQAMQPQQPTQQKKPSKDKKKKEKKLGEKKSKKGLIITLIIILVVLILGISAAIMFKTEIIDFFETLLGG